MLNGIINVYKEAGYTSRDAVSRLTGILRQRKIGHTGTLDPAAEGVLPMCIGSATKLCEMLTGHKKEYLATMKLGFATDTEDTTGVVTESTDLYDTWYKENITEERVKEVLLEFIGEIEQIPPMYSAKKVNGKRLYELARQGKIIERKPSRIFIYQIELKKIDLIEKTISIRVECSKGTYIRTLCKDIGEKLGTKASMDSLLRTKTGDFTMEQSYSLDELEKLMKEGRIAEVILPIEMIFKDFEKINLNGHESILMENGAILTVSSLQPFLSDEHFPLSDGKKFRMYNENGEFKAVYTFMESRQAFKVDKMF